MSNSNLALPKRERGRPTIEAKAAYDAQLTAWCEAIEEINRGLGFKIGVRGWCYILESHGLPKGDFDKAADLLTECRKKGLLPLNICASDKSRSMDGGQWWLDNPDPVSKAASHIDYLQDVWRVYTPLSFWEDQPYYLQLLVEKIDLKSLFSPICERYHIRYGNAKGWSDLNQRGDLIKEFQAAEKRGQIPVLLYCGDHDPTGLAISDTMLSNICDLTVATKWLPDKLIIDRFGLNRDFIEANNLTWIEGLGTSGDADEDGKGKDLSDPTHKDHYKPYVQDYLGARCP